MRLCERGMGNQYIIDLTCFWKGIIDHGKPGKAHMGHGRCNGGWIWLAYDDFVGKAIWPYRSRLSSNFLLIR